MTENVPATVFGGKVNVKDMKSLAAKAQNAAQNNPRGGAPNGSDYMNFSGKRGVYTIGQDNREIHKDEVWIVDVTSFEEGWVCWKGGTPAATRLANIYNGVPVEQPDPNEFGPFTGDGDGWSQAKAMVLKSCDNDQQGYFKINSVSGVSAMAELIGEFAERAASGLPCWPVVRLDKEEFTARGYKNFKPKFAIEGWLDNDGIARLVAGDDVMVILEDGGNTDQIEDQTEEEPEEEPEPPKTTRRRRTRG